MAFPNDAHRDTQEQRRERVAQLRLRGLSAREISLAMAMGDNAIVNPHTGKPYDHKTILADLQALKAQWRASAGVATDEHIARQFAELQELKRFAWSQKDGDLALKALGSEMKLLGTMKQPEGLVINIQIVNQLVQAIEQRGDDPAEWFEAMLQEFQLADGS